ncbi:MAG: RNA-binding domain-containing protein [Candidatus Bathyarchaeia archaeon]|jgi:RNA binding exosome subunit
MSSKLPIEYVDIRVSAHATEDLQKVQAAVRNLMPDELAQTIFFETANLTGHYGNPITLVTTKLTDKKLLSKALEKIGAGLNSLDKEQLCTDLVLHLERGNLYLRFDKQAALLGQFKFTQNDPIHLKIHFKNKTSDQIIELCRASGMFP